MTITIDARGTHRRAPGAPVGGQFAPKPAPREAMKLSSADRVGFIRESGIIRAAIAKKFGHVVDVDEVMATVNEVATQKLARGDWTQLEGNWGFLRRTAENQAVTQANEGMRSEERSATVKLKQEMERRAQELGREVTAAERSALAEDIRLSYPPKRRPRIGWDSIERTDSLDRELTDDGGTVGTVGATVEADEQEEQSIWDDALRLMTTNHSASGVSAEQVALRVWGIFRAEDDSIPAVVSMPKVGAQRALEAVQQHGLEELITAWEDGERTQRVAAVFAPFGMPDQRGQQSVVDVLSRNRARATQLWQLAVATTQRADLPKAA